LSVVQGVLTQKAYKVLVVSPNGSPVGAQVNGSTLHTDGDMTVVADQNSGSIYVFLGLKEDPTKLMLDPAGNLMVAVKPTTAGP
jgi:hypothetical protein